MIPNIFISSTISDLQYLREALRDTVEEMAYRPVLSEFGDIGYLPQTSAEDSCYLAMRDCQIAVLIVGKRYGSVSSNQRSITHNEFYTARENTIPVICLVDREVLSYKKIFDANTERQEKPTFPGMDAPNETFLLIQDIMNAPVNNGVLPFDSVADARLRLKTQLAHVFGDLLRSKFDTVKAGIKDVLSEVMTLRQEMKNKEMDPQPFLKASRFLLDDGNRQFREFLEIIHGSIEGAIPNILKYKTFDEYLIGNKVKIDIKNKSDMLNEFAIKKNLVFSSYWGVSSKALEHPDDQKRVAHFYALLGKKIVMNEEAKEYFDYRYENLIRNAGV